MDRRRPLAALFAAALLTASFASSALAADYTSPSKITTTGSNTLAWTGQGTTGGTLNTTECDSASDPYLLWIFTTDGGSVSGTPTLHIGGSGSGDYTGTAFGGEWHIFTPYFTPDGSLTAYVSFNTVTTGGGAWNLTISHGCPGGGGGPQGAALSVTKDAAGAYKDTYTWQITKAVDKTLVKQVGGSATFNYTVTVTPDGGTISDVKVTGTIDVFNPNIATVTGVNVTDKLSDGTVCTVTGGSAATVGTGDTFFAYACDLGSTLPTGTIDNTATISWDSQTLDPDGLLPSGTAKFTVSDISFTPNNVDECVTVTDTFTGAGTTTLGVACQDGTFTKDAGNTLTGFASSYTDPTFTFTYSRSVPVPTWNCSTFDNTATFTTNDTGTTGSAGQSVMVCGPAKTGALTMGFWQNKNGQGIISGGASTAGVCNSGTWLRTFAPFQDLSATANCSQVASYVYGVIKAANAGGATMNLMLKAQDLATSLDVYFSDPALGGNKIGAPSPIGAQNIDLTLVCNMIDGSGGSGSCSGSYTNVSAAFGGATCMTVLQAITYEAAQSNSGGSVWYGQVKATQGLAKDLDDAINNQVVFNC